MWSDKKHQICNTSWLENISPKLYLKQKLDSRTALDSSWRRKATQDPIILKLIPALCGHIAELRQSSYNCTWINI